MSGDARQNAGKPGTPPGTDPAAAGGADPSMEDILASIRRILNEEENADDGGIKPEDADEADDDALPLSEDMLISAPEAAPEPPAPEPPPVIVASPPPPPPPAPEPPPPVLISQPLPEPEPALAPESLLAPAAAAAATASLGALIKTVAAERSAAVHRGGPTVEDVVREAIRPMLKEWLDTHLPPLVERLVRAEIERVVGRALS